MTTAWRLPAADACRRPPRCRAAPRPQVHEDAIQDMQLSPDGSYVITASLDKTAQLVDVCDLEVRGGRGWGQQGRVGALADLERGSA